MLQQTQVNRVLVKYAEFLRAFPTISSLAKAARASVIRAWRGLGYNSRAVRLHELARIVGDPGRLPHDEEALRALPGVGPYTARALMVFAYGKNVAAVDVNMRRVLSRVFWRMKRTSDLQALHDVEALAVRLLPRRTAFDWNQAIMDLGATVCVARSPQCSSCVMAKVCVSAGRMRPGRGRPERPEPMMDGIPNRIYRGRVVDHLRRTRRPISLDLLGRSIHPKFSRGHRPWLERLLAGLEKDGLVKQSGSGSHRFRRILLA